MHAIHLVVPFLAAAVLGQAPASTTAKAAATPALEGSLTCVVPVRDLEAAIAWYGDALGMRLKWKDLQIGFAEVQTADGDVTLGLARQPEPKVEPGVVLTFGVLDIAAAEAALKAKKVATQEIVTYPGLVKLLPFQDRDGNTLQLFESLQSAPPAHAGLEAVAFLAGSWVRQDGDNREEEHWTAPAGGLMVGMARMVKGGKATFFESLRIEKTARGIVYHATPSGQPTTAFTLDPSKSGPRKAVFENPEHDFPKRVTYWLADDGRLHARIEGEKDGKTRGHDFVWARGGLR
jgi:predicted enzyme related to lactoylglutathione lyase